MPARATRPNYGRKLLAEDPHCSGSLGIAISEAIEDTVTHPNTKYSLGSVLNHVCLHQTVIGQESIKQMEMAGEEPDVIFGCAGGGSNFAGIAFPFIQKKIKEKKKYRIVGGRAVRLSVAHQGRTALRLRRHGGDDAADDDVHAGPQVHAALHSRRRAALPRHGPDGQPRPQARADRGRGVSPDQGVRGGTLFARSEGIVPAPESAHAIAAVVDEAIAAREAGKKRVILFNLSGHGLLDLSAYETYLSGKIQDV